ncbi:MAG: hypothetical protein ACK57D_14495 [Sphingobacteriales bacterium]|jgi:hypothetical protein
MYLRKAWHYNKLFFTLVVLFIIGQAFVTYNRGMVFSPFFNYSMYATKFPRVDSIGVIEMYSEGKLLSPTEVSPRSWDKLTMAYSYSADLQKNEWFVSEIIRLTSGVGLQWPTDPYLNKLSDEALDNKWRAMFLKITGRKLDSVKRVTYQNLDGKWIRK